MQLNDVTSYRADPSCRSVGSSRKLSVMDHYPTPLLVQVMLPDVLSSCTCFIPDSSPSRYEHLLGDLPRQPFPAST